MAYRFAKSAEIYSEIAFRFPARPLVAKRAINNIQASLGWTARATPSFTSTSGRPASSSPDKQIRSRAPVTSSSFSPVSIGPGVGRWNSVTVISSSSISSGSASSN